MVKELVLPSKEEEMLNEVAEETPVVTEETQEEIKKEPEVKDVEGETPKERALREEVTRLKKERREARQLVPLESKADDEPIDEVQVTKSEALVYNSFQQEALDEFLEAHPHYNDDEDQWKSFMAENEDRVPLVDYAKKKGVPLTKKLIRERLDSIHRALGADVQGAKEEGKKELLRTQSAAQIMAAGSKGGHEVQPEKQPVKQNRFKKSDTGLESWLSKKK